MRFVADESAAAEGAGGDRHPGGDEDVLEHVLAFLNLLRRHADSWLLLRIMRRGRFTATGGRGRDRPSRVPVGPFVVAVIEHLERVHTRV
jgi:hypothetical protein